ncbi:sensor histidine kinase [Dactylosporangium sp. NPDC048998]|uniref:sensor histidine kinase n=1 Tax=Dactylosporangium sp. NPDC048998 TaxID=3363976 RepID=UPI003721B824
MRRFLAAAGIVAVDSVLLTFAHPGPPGPAGLGRPALLPVWALVVASVIVLRYRSPAAAFVCALGPAVVTGGATALLPWSAYQAGRSVRRTTSWVVMWTAAAVALGAEIALRPAAAAPLVVASVVFVLLPMLAGRYVAEQERRAAALAAQERLRIARDMHDALGHRLSLVSVQAAALEVAGLPAEQRAAVRRLAESARGAASDLHEVVTGLRAPRPGLAAVGDLVAGARAAGVRVDLVVRGSERELPEEAGPVAYRVVQEGLTNGVKHAPGAPLTVRADWEDDALLLSVANPAPAAAAPAPPGRGLLGLAERAELAGGLVGHGLAGGEFRLWAVFPVAPAPRRPALLGLAVAGLMFGFVPLSLMVGVA